MAEEICVFDSEEFEDMIAKRDLRISKAFDANKTASSIS
jgi:hypothetical protein